MAMVTTAPARKLCLSNSVCCGKKGQRHQVNGGTIINCRNPWGCRYQLDLTEMPDKERQERLKLALAH